MKPPKPIKTLLTALSDIQHFMRCQRTNLDRLRYKATKARKRLKTHLGLSGDSAKPKNTLNNLPGTLPKA